MMTNFWSTVFWAIFSWILSAFPFKLYHEKLSHIFSGTCITTYTNFTWILRLMTLRLDPATIRQSFASDQNWKRMCWLASFADFHQKPEPITMFTCPHVSKKMSFSFPDSRKHGKPEIAPWKVLFASFDLTSFVFRLQSKLKKWMCWLASFVGFHRKLPFPELRKIWEIALCMHLSDTI